MENEKLFEFMEKMYSEMQSEFKELRQDVSGLKQDVSGLKQDVSGLKQDVNGLKQEVRKNSIRLDSIEKKVDILAEVQSNHMCQNEKNHIEIVETLNGEIELTKKAVSKVSLVK